MDFDKEKEGAIEMDIGTGLVRLEYNQKNLFVNNFTNEPLNGKYYHPDLEAIRYYKKGKIHRDNNLPVSIYKNGNIFYAVEGKSHRTDGPASLYGGINFYWINGKQIDNEEINKWLSENNISIDWNNWSEGDKNKFASYWTGIYGSPYVIEEVSDLLKDLTKEKEKFEKEMEMLQKKIDAINILIYN